MDLNDDCKKSLIDLLDLNAYPRQGIETKYLAPTNHKPGRIKASAAAGSIIISWDHGLNPTENHALAAKALADKFKWNYLKILQAGNLKGSGYFFILI